MRVLEVNHRRHAHLRDETLQDIGGYLQRVRWSFQYGDSHAGRLAAYSEDPRLAPANDIYFDLRALYA